MLDKLIFLVALAGTAVVFADVLVRDGMLLQPVQRWLREAWRRRPYITRAIAEVLRVEQRLASREPGGELDSVQLAAIAEIRNAISEAQELDGHWWWKPLWGCSSCVAGQWGFWGYLIRYHKGYAHGWARALFDTLPEHIAFTAFTIITAIILAKWTE